jgi:hypothetical protein
VVTLARTSSGLLYRSDGSLAGWTSGGDWSSVSTNRFVAAPTGPIQAGMQSLPQKGESNMHVSDIDGSWYLSFGGKIINDVPLPGIQHSSDRGITWVDLGVVSFTPPTAVVSGFDLYYDPSGTWINQATEGTPPSTPWGGINTPYFFKILQSTSGIAGPYSAVQTFANFSGTWGNTGLSAGGAYFDGTNYNLFAGGVNTVGVEVIGLLQGTSWSGSFTQPSPSTPVYDVTVNGPNLSAVSMFGCEGAYVALNSVLGLYVLIVIGLANAGGTVNGYCYSAILQTSTSLTFPTSGWKHIQWVCPADASAVVQQSAFVYAGKNNAPLLGPNGEMLLITTGQAPGYNDLGIGGHDANQIALYAVLEPASAVLRYTGSADTTYRQLVRSLDHTDITIECVSELTGINGSGEFHITYRSDGTSNNEYRAVLATGTHWRLDKIVSGTRSALAAGSGTQVYSNQGATLGMLHRLKVQVIGNVHQAWLDGELQYTVTDTSSPFASGSHMTVAGIAINTDVINLSCRTSDTITVTGMQPNTSVWLRAACGIPIAPLIANSSGVGTISYGHFPLFSLDIGGTDYTVGSDSRIWGGDTLQFSGLPASSPVAPPYFIYT